MQIALFSLDYAAANVSRRVAYEDSPRRIVVTNVALDASQRPGRAVGDPDAWPTADGDLLLARYEGTETVRLYATRAYPFARFEVTAAPPADTCDLRVDLLASPVNTVTFTVSTSHGPWASSLTANVAEFVEGKNSYPLLPGTQHTLYVRDAQGCQVTQTLYTPEPGEPAAGSTTTGPPAGAILLRRRTLPGFTGPDYYRVKEEYYDPATRTAALYFLPESLDSREYSRPTDEIIDRWCTEPGVAPYTERRVTHNGSGGVTFTDVDNVEACQRRCTLALSLSATPTMNGRSDLTATATGAQGAVLFSLDNFRTAGLAATIGADGLPHYVFTGLRVGTYPVWVKETRAGGCSATATITIEASYGPRYKHTFKDRANASCELLIFEREYVGAVEVLPHAQKQPVTLDWPGSVSDHLFSQLVRGSECSLQLYFTYAEQLLPLFSGDERLHRVEVRRAEALLWVGFLLPEQYEVAFLAPPSTFNLSASDGLGTLSTLPLVAAAGQPLTGSWRLLDLVLFLLGKLDLHLPLRVLWRLYPSTAQLGTGALEQIRVDVSQYLESDGKPWDCGKVLNELLTSFQARLYQAAGAWWLERLADVEPGATYASYSPLGVRGADVAGAALLPVGRADDGSGYPFWQGKQQRQSLRPAVSSIVVAAEPGDPSNFLAPALPTNADLPAPRPATWTASVPASGQPMSQLVYQGKDKPPTLRLVGTAAYASTPHLADWVQLPATQPVPLRDFGATGVAYNGTFTLSFTAKPYGNTPSDKPELQSTLYVALNFGGVWVTPYLAFPGESAHVEDVLKQSYVKFADSQEQKFSFRGYGASPQGPQPVLVRLYQPVGGATACTVDITDLELVWEHVEKETADKWVSEYATDTGALVSRTDVALKLFHSDTPFVRRRGTVLDAGHLPTQGWQVAGQPGGLVRELGDWLVYNRNLWQRRPAQVLSGLLRGLLPQGPGTLLTDPAEARPAVYLGTNCTYDVAAQTWQVTGVQDSLLVAPQKPVTPGQPAPPEALPEQLIYSDDLTAWLDEASRYLVYENG